MVAPFAIHDVVSEMKSITLKHRHWKFAIAPSPPVSLFSTIAYPLCSQ
jgi:hypothetical protein